MKKLVVLDTEKKKVHLYKVDPKAVIDEERIEILGYNTNNCWWLLDEDIAIIEHKGTLI